ncbi:MAG: tail fiber domain-containing protein [Bacteroidota bacterium]
MKQIILQSFALLCANSSFSQNVGIGTVTPTQVLHVVGDKAFFQTNFFGIGTSTPTTGFTGFAMKSAVNTFYGSYIDAGPTGVPFYGYALNGVPKGYLSFNGPNSALEYHQTSDGTPDFYVKGNMKSVFNTDTTVFNAHFVGIGTSIPTTGFTGFAMKSAANTFYGSYVDAGPTGVPFYGYALNGVPKGYLSFNGPNSALEYHQTSDGTPDFYVKGSMKSVFNTDTTVFNARFVGIGTSTPTTGFTGFAMKTASNTFYGSYIDAGPTGIPFYGYALNGVPRSYLSYNGSNAALEYHQSSDGTPDFFIKGNSKAVFNTDTALFNTNFVGIGTNTPTTSAAGLSLKNNISGYYGMYIDGGTNGQPFYGYAINGSAKAWTTFNDVNNNWELNYGGVRISVGSTGNVGIGASPSVTAKLDVGGTIHALNLAGGATTLSTDASGNIIRTPSDATLKNKVADISNALTKVMKMHGVTYNFIDENRFGGNRQMGFLAQELEQVVPEAVSSGGEYKSVNYQVLTALLAEAMKEQQQQIDEKQKENEFQQNQIAELVKRIEKLEKKKN